MAIQRYPERSKESEIEHPFAALQSFPTELSSSGTKGLTILTLGLGVVPQPSLWEAGPRKSTYVVKAVTKYPADYSTKHWMLDDVGPTMP